MVLNYGIKLCKEEPDFSSLNKSWPDHQWLIETPLIYPLNELIILEVHIFMQK